MRTCDLHTHSIFSDGTDSPTKLINDAIELELSAVALCDHNTVDGLPEFLSAAEGKNIEAVPGAEFSVEYNGVEMHLLGLFIPKIYFKLVNLWMKEAADAKLESNREMIAALNQAGYKISFEAIQSATPKGNFNRAHVACALLEHGYIASIDEAFETLLSPEGGFYKEPPRISIWDMLKFLNEIDAVSVLAHPFLQLDEAQLTQLLPLAKAHGLAGMECLYSTYDAATTECSFRLARQFDLKPSGGSDYHGIPKPDIALGKGRGNLEIPYEWVADLKKSAGEITR